MSKDDCVKRCVPAASDCDLPKVEGNCRDRLKTKRYYFDKTDKKCKDFQACPNGEGNNFENLDVCNTTCICNLPNFILTFF